MSGKHAPESPASFYWSIARAAAGALAVLGLVIAIAVVAVQSQDGEEDPIAGGSPTPTTTTTVRSTTTATPSAQPTLRPPAEVTVLVLNGAGVQGLAARVSSEIEEEGYRVRTPGNTPPTERTRIYFRRDARQDAEALRRLKFRSVDRVRRAPDRYGDANALVIVVLGRDYED